MYEDRQVNAFCARTGRDWSGIAGEPTSPAASTPSSLDKTDLEILATSDYTKDKPQETHAIGQELSAQKRHRTITKDAMRIGRESVCRRSEPVQ